MLRVKYDYNQDDKPTNDKPQCKSHSKVATSMNPDRLFSYVCNLLPRDFTTLSSLVREKLLRDDSALLGSTAVQICLTYPF